MNDTKINSLDSYYGEFIYEITSELSKIQLARYIYNVKQASMMERGNRSEARGDTRMIPVVPFLCKKVRLRWRGVTATKASQRHEGLTLFSGNHRHEGLGYSSTMGIP